MGLLDGLMGESWDDPRTQAMLALSAGLLSANGSKGLSAGLLGAGSAYQGAQDAATKRKLTQAQIDSYNSEVSARADAAKRAQSEQEWALKLFQGGGAPAAVPAAQGQLGSGTAGGAPMIPQGAGQQLGFLKSLNEDQILGLVKLGKMPESAIKLWEFAKFGKERQPGTYTEMTDGTRKFNENPKDLIGYDPNTRTVSPLNGAIETNAAIKGAETMSTERAKSAFDLVDVYDPTTRAMVKVPRSQALAAANGGMPSARPGEVANPWVGDPAQTRAAIMAMRDPQARAEALRQFTEAQGQRGGAMQTGPSVTEQTDTAVQRTQLEAQAKDVADQRKNIMSSGFNAPAKIANLTRIDNLLGNFEGGKLSQTGMDIASTANSLGFRIDKNLPNKEAAQALSREIALGLRNPAGGAGMPGAMSDADRNYLTSLTPSMSQTADGRKSIIAAHIAVERRNQQIADFARKYENKYKVLDNGFFSQLQSWSDANPLFGAQ